MSEPQTFRKARKKRSTRMSRIKMLGLVFVLAAVAALGTMPGPAKADPVQCDGCWEAGWGTHCYPEGYYRCFGGGGGCIGGPPGSPACGGGGMGYLHICGPNDWIYIGTRC
jgi:hypothetical protein